MTGTLAERARECPACGSGDSCMRCWPLDAEDFCRDEWHNAPCDFDAASLRGIAPDYTEGQESAEYIKQRWGTESRELIAELLKALKIADEILERNGIERPEIAAAIAKAETQAAHPDACKCADCGYGF